MQLDELGPLTLGETADRFAGRDPARREDLVHLHAPVLRHRQQEVEDLRGLEELGRVEQELVDRLPSGLEITLELRTPTANVVGPLERFHALHERSLGRRDGLC